MTTAAQITILIPDPDEMMFITGMNDQNIDRIEREFSVKIVSRGAELRISGEVWFCCWFCCCSFSNP